MKTPTAVEEVEKILERTATLYEDEHTLRKLALELDEARKSLGHNTNPNHRLYSKD